MELLRPDEQRAFHESQARYHEEMARLHGQGGHQDAERAHGLAQAAHEQAAQSPHSEKLVKAAMRSSSMADDQSQRVLRNRG